MAEPDPYFEDVPEQWDTVYIYNANGTGYPLPGVATITGSAEYGIDVRLAPLLSGAFYHWKGNPPITLTIKLMWWSAQHWREWHNVYEYIRPPAKRQLRPKTVGIAHPICNLAGIQEVIFTKVGLPEVALNGVTSVSMTAVQYLKPIPVREPNVRDTNVRQGIFNPLDGSPSTPPQPPPSAGAPPVPRR